MAGCGSVLAVWPGEPLEVVEAVNGLVHGIVGLQRGHAASLDHTMVVPAGVGERMNGCGQAVDVGDQAGHRRPGLVERDGLDGS